jgi:hypothetical protein
MCPRWKSVRSWATAASAIAASRLGDRRVPPRGVELADRDEADRLEVPLFLGLSQREGVDAAAVDRPVVVAERGGGELDDSRLLEGIPELPPLRRPDVVRLVDEEVLAVFGHARDDVGLALAREGHRGDDDVALLEQRLDRGGVARPAVQDADDGVAGVARDDLEPRRLQEAERDELLGDLCAQHVGRDHDEEAVAPLGDQGREHGFGLADAGREDDGGGLGARGPVRLDRVDRADLRRPEALDLASHVLLPVAERAVPRVPGRKGVRGKLVERPGRGSPVRVGFPVAVRQIEHRRGEVGEVDPRPDRVWEGGRHPRRVGDDQDVRVTGRGADTDAPDARLGVGDDLGGQGERRAGELADDVPGFGQVDVVEGWRLDEHGRMVSAVVVRAAGRGVDLPAATRGDRFW